MIRGSKILVAGLTVLFAAAALAQPYPSRPIRFVVGSPSGTTPDVVARLIGQKLSESWGNPVVVEARAGAAGMVAAEFVTKSPPDGYTLLFSDNSSWSINPHLFARIPYDPLKDFTPVIQAGILPMFLAVVPSLPVSSLGELLDYARKNPGKLSYGTAGNGSIHHITTELLKTMAGVDIVHVPYKGSGQSATALLGGEIQFAFSGYTSVAQPFAAGKLRILAVSTAQRSPLLPNVPTVAEAGLPGFDMSAPVGFNGPAGMPRDLVAKLNAGIASALAAQEVNAKMAALGITVAPTSPEQFAGLIKAEYEKFGKLVRQSGARND